MKKEFLAIAMFLIISNIAMAQQPGLGIEGGSSGGGMMHRPIPNAPLQANLKPPFLKGDQALAETWSSTIAALGNNPDGMAVNCFAEDSDNLYIGGDFLQFDTVQTQFIVQYNRKTGVCSNLGGGFDNNVYSLAVHKGILYAAGAFDQTYDGSTVLNYIAQWDGTSWQSVGDGMNSSVNSIAFVGDTLYAGGNFTKAGGISTSYLAYWDGQNWYEAFMGTSYPVQALLATHDSLFVGGDFNYVGSETRNTGLRAQGTAMLQDGNWTPLGSGYYCNCFAMFQGSLWVGGEYYLGDGVLADEIASWNGSAWTTYSMDTLVGTNSTGDVNALVVIGDTLLALGNFSSMAGVNANGLAIYSNGAWSPYAGGLYGEGLGAILFNGKLYVGGRFTKAGTVDATALAMLSNSVWTPVARMTGQNVGWGSDEVTVIATTDRYIFIGGYFETIAGQTCNHVAAWDKQLKSWITLGSGVDGDVHSLAVKGDTLVVGGSFNHAGTVTAQHIAMCNVTTKLWYPMGAGAHRYVSAITVNDDSIYAPISYTYNGTHAYDYLGQWNGADWNMYGNGLTVGYIEALAWQGSTLFAAGSFGSSDDGTVLDGIAQIQSGGSWGSLNDGLNNTVYALAPSGDSLYVGGAFTKADGQVDTSLAVWNNTTQVWNPIGAAGFNGQVNTLAADGKGGVYAGGNFGEVAQVGRGNLVHWNGSSFGTVASGADNTVEALATDESALYAGGWFEAMDNGTITSLHFGALNGAGASVSIPPSANITSLSIYPNPASSSSMISVGLAKAGNVRIEIFNALGSRVALLADGNYQSGQQDFAFDASKLLSGIYFLRLTNNGVVSTENFIVERE